jgi:hypothetical protein
MIVKLIQYWDVLLGRQREFDDFLRDEYIPLVEKSDLMRVAEAWNVLVGEGPFFSLEGIAKSIDDIESLILSDDYRRVKECLFQYVTNYYSKIITPREDIFPSPIVTEEGFKYVQNFDISPPDYYEFLNFATDEYLPGLEGLAMTMVGSWYVDVGPTPHRAFEWYANRLETIAGLFDDLDFQKLTAKFVSMTSDYRCKLLFPSGHTGVA